MVHSVEKERLEKIRWLLEISEQEHHYTLAIIPRSLPSEIVDGEHFVTTNLLSLIAGSAPPSGDPKAETSSQEQASRALSVPSASTSGDSIPAQLGPS